MATHPSHTKPPAPPKEGSRREEAMDRRQAQVPVPVLSPMNQVQKKGK